MKLFKLVLLSVPVLSNQLTQKLSSRLFKSIGSKEPTDYYSSNLPTLPFPSWLTDMTGLREWPGMDPPYIPLDFIDLKGLPGLKPYQQGQCDINLREQSCSFDCFNCVSYDDVYTCPVLSQTFDDGPSEETPQLLEQLTTKSTFFTLGVQTIRFPEAYRDAVKRGHVMGSHTWSHKFLPSLTNEQIVAQLEWSVWSMNATSGHLPKWFRPPFGGLDNRVRSIVRKFGMQSVLWDFDTFDWKLLESGTSRTEGEIVADLTKFKVEKGNRGLILEHDAVKRTVDVGIALNHGVLAGNMQMTVPECVGGIKYIKEFS